uniref:AlNc14C189G8418 protein n=1 Tax=Albugo laibachii Nc14 TaxID=890382 RepID=F0WPS6_9STRA|nr:AlNc14C189G8418 [Albugo laibachii Nc14]|eukprot:CCA23327.1 AlNc14C189G8418 [Albugo laibachii Nc14]
MGRRSDLLWYGAQRINPILNLGTETSTTTSNQETIASMQRIGETKASKKEDPVLYHDEHDSDCVPDLGTTSAVKKHDDQAQVKQVLECKVHEAINAGCPPAVSDQLQSVLLDTIDSFCLQLIPGRSVDVPALKEWLKDNATPFKCKARRYPK